MPVLESPKNFGVDLGDNRLTASAIRSMLSEQGKSKVKRNNLHLPSPHSSEQETYLHSKAKIVVAAWGTKGGKTFGSSEWLVKQAWQLGLGETMPHWWVAPIYRQAKIADRLIRAFLPQDKKRVRYYKIDKRIEILKSDGRVHSVIEFRSAEDPDNLQGDGIGPSVVDEADRIKRESWESFFTTVTKTQSPVRIISSPKRRNWFWELFKLGQKLTADQRRRIHNGEQGVTADGIVSMQCPTWVNPYVPKEAIDRLRSILPERVFRSYVEAQFPESDGLVFRNIQERFSDSLYFESQPVPGERYIASLDLAKVTDYSQLIIGSVQRRCVVWVERWRGMSWEATWRRAMAAAEFYNNADMIIDATTYGDPILENMQNANSPCHVEGYNFAGKSKQPLIENLVLGFEKGDFLIPNDPALRYAKEELEIYEFDVTPSGNVQYSAPEGMHDDFVSSLALWYWYLSHQVIPGIRIFSTNNLTGRPQVSEKLVSDEEVARMLQEEERKMKEAVQRYQNNQFLNALRGSDDEE